MDNGFIYFDRLPLYLQKVFVIHFSYKNESIIRLVCKAWKSFFLLPKVYHPEETSLEATRQGNFSLLKWLVKNKCPCYGYNEVLEWLIKNGCSYNKILITYKKNKEFHTKESHPKAHDLLNGISDFR